MMLKVLSCLLWPWEETYSQIVPTLLSGGQGTHSSGFDIDVLAESGSNHLIGRATGLLRDLFLLLSPCG